MVSAGHEDRKDISLLNAQPRTTTHLILQRKITKNATGNMLQHYHAMSGKEQDLKAVRVIQLFEVAGHGCDTIWVDIEALPMVRILTEAPVHVMQRIKPLKVKTEKLKNIKAILWKL